MQRRAEYTARGQRVPPVSASLLIAASALAVVCGCSPGEHVTATGAPHHPGANPGPGNMGFTAPDHTRSSNLTITPEQRSYLDALTQAGVDPTSDLMALSIGSYICQAHAAGQSEQAVRDFVLPLVRGDLHNAHPGVAVTSMASQVDDVTSTYVRIATDRLC